MVNPDLAGGSILDQWVLMFARPGPLAEICLRGPYPSVWAMLALYQHPDNNKTAPKLVSSYQHIYPKTGVDQSSRWVLEWPGLDGVVANLMTDIHTAGYAPATALIQCEKADIAIECTSHIASPGCTGLTHGSDPPYRPERFNIIPHSDGAGNVKDKKEEFRYPVAAGGGWHYQADEVARCVRDGKIESERMPWEESRVVQSWFDQVRKQGGSVLKDLKGKSGN